jgi:glycosyltransferase involved in cell wall biosynthesis
LQLKIVQLNLAFDPRLATPAALLAAYHTLTGWSAAVSHAGAAVETIQRFSRNSEVAHEGSRYRFVDDGAGGVPPPWDRVARTVRAVVEARPDVVHINGLMFPGCVRALRAALPSDTAIVLQDHSGAVPRAWPWPLAPLSVARWRRAFAECDACTFTARALADRWHRHGLPHEVPVLEIPEASASLAPIERREAAAHTGITAGPALLWVGRLDDNKDPLTVLTALAQALPQLPEARCWMIFQGGELEGAVRRRVAGDPILRDRVTLVGSVPHDRMHVYYSAADILLSGSHHEGSGYALIEAMACGVRPCVTDIPAFRALAGPAGAMWTPGEADSCAGALLTLAGQPPDRAAVRAHFDTHLHWNAIGDRTVRAYHALFADPRSLARRQGSV